MAAVDATPLRVDGDVEPDLDSLGVINALERTCELEAKLRQAIQQTHPLTTSLDWDFNAADREREALLAISEQLEYLEDKLREYRFLGAAASGSDHKAVLLGQLDAVRRELLDVLAVAAPKVVFAKEAVREVVAFAAAGEDTPRPGLAAASPAAPPSGRPRRGAPPPPPPPLAAESSLFSLISNSPKPSPGAGAGSGTAAKAPSPAGPYVSTHDNELWEGGIAARRDRLAVPVPGATTAGGLAPGVADRDRPRRSYASAGASGITDEDIYGPGGGSIAGAGGSVAGAGAASLSAASGASYGGMVRIREMLERAEEGLSAAKEAQQQRRTPPRVFGDAPAAAAAAGPLGGTEEWDGMGDSPAAPLAAPEFVTPRDGGDGGAVLWPGGTSAAARTPGSLSAASPGGYSVRDWGAGADSALSAGRSYGYASTPGTAGGSANGGERQRGGGVGALVGKLAGLAFLLGGVAAAAVVVTNGQAVGDKAAKAPAKRGASSAAAAASAKARSRRPAAANGKRPRPTAATGRKGEPADVPPWTEGATSTAGGEAPRARPAPPSPARGSSAPQQSPVMHVHRPPNSGSFPSTPPPDVTAAMG